MLAQAKIKMVAAAPPSGAKQAPPGQKGTTVLEGSGKEGVSTPAKPVIALTPTGAAAPTTQWRADVMTAGYSKGSQSAPANTHANPLSASKRSTAACDQDTMEKATMLKAKKNPDGTPNKGNPSTVSSFINFENSVLASKVASLGVSLGSSGEQVNKALVRLKSVEKGRLHERVQLEQQTLQEDEGSVDGDIDLQALSSLCNDLTDCVGDGDCDLNDLQFSISPTNKRGPGEKERKVKIK